MNPHAFSGLNAPKLHKAEVGIGTYGVEAESTDNFSNTKLTNQIGLQEDWNLLKMPDGVIKLDIRRQIYKSIKFKGYR